MELWIIASLAAALFQTVRFMLQKQLSAVALSAAGAIKDAAGFDAVFAAIVVLLLAYAVAAFARRGAARP